MGILTFSLENNYIQTEFPINVEARTPRPVIQLRKKPQLVMVEANLDLLEMGEGRTSPETRNIVKWLLIPQLSSVF